MRAVEGERDDGLDSEKGDDQAGEAAEDGEDDAFGEGLADEPLARGSEGEANRGLGAARGSASEQQIGDVGAGDEQDQAADGEQDMQAVGVVGLHDADACACGHDVDVLLGQAGLDAGHPLGGDAAVIDEPLANSAVRRAGMAPVTDRSMRRAAGGR